MTKLSVSFKAFRQELEITFHPLKCCSYQNCCELFWNPLQQRETNGLLPTTQAGNPPGRHFTRLLPEILDWKRRRSEESMQLCTEPKHA